MGGKRVGGACLMLTPGVIMGKKAQLCSFFSHFGAIFTIRLKKITSMSYIILSLGFIKKVLTLTELQRLSVLNDFSMPEVRGELHRKKGVSASGRSSNEQSNVSDHLIH